MVVKRAESAFSGSKDFLKAVSPAVEAALSSGSAFGSTGTSIPKSAITISPISSYPMFVCTGSIYSDPLCASVPTTSMARGV